MKGRQGFSLIEILIATSILLVIVVMVSMVFQQQSAAFQSGEDRVKGQATARNIVGMIVRDLSLAVDSADYDGLPGNSFSKNTISFLALSGTPGYDMDGKASDGEVALQRITYSGGSLIERSVQGYTLRDGGWSTAERSSAKLNGKDNLLKSLTFTEASGGSGKSKTLPDYITIKAVYDGISHSTAVRGHSAGPDRRWNTGDDIYVGGKDE